MVFKTSILLGAGAEGCAQTLLAKKLISNLQRLAPPMVNAVRILIIVAGGDQDYNNALNAVIKEAVDQTVAWRHEDYLTYGDPRNKTWEPPMAIPPNYVSVG